MFLKNEKALRRRLENKESNLSIIFLNDEQSKFRALNYVRFLIITFYFFNLFCDRMAI